MEASISTSPLAVRYDPLIPASNRPLSSILATAVSTASRTQVGFMSSLILSKKS
jgi:hypothetical protein